MTHLLINGKYRNVLSLLVFLFSFFYLALPFYSYFNNPQGDHILIMSNSDTIRNIIMILIGYYFGSSDYTPVKTNHQPTKEGVDIQQNTTKTDSEVTIS